MRACVFGDGIGGRRVGMVYIRYMVIAIERQRQFCNRTAANLSLCRAAVFCVLYLSFAVAPEQARRCTLCDSSSERLAIIAVYNSSAALHGCIIRSYLALFSSIARTVNKEQQ